MILSAIKHYLFVGLFFAFAGGWVLTLLFNGFLRLALEESGVLRGEAYWWALLSTFTSLAIIAVVAVAGNRLYRQHFGPSSMSQWALVISTILFMATVSPIIGPQLSFAIDKIERNLSRTGPDEALKLLSLPLLRWCLLPLCYVLAGRMLLPHSRTLEAEAMKPGTGGA